MNFTRVTIAAALALASSSAPLQAQIFSGSGCAGTSFTFCAEWQGEVFAPNRLVFSLTNVSLNANSKFTKIVIGGVNLPADPTHMSPITGWQYDASVNGFDGLGLKPSSFASLTSNGINNALGVGQTLTLEFFWGVPVFLGMSGDEAAETFFGTHQVGIHDQGTPDYGHCDDSSKGVMYHTGYPTVMSQYQCTNPVPPPSNNPEQGPQGTIIPEDEVIVSVTPEPSTYVLMAAGLAGLFGVSRRRRQA